MPTLTLCLQVFLSFSFLIYGASCIFSKKAVGEFRRYGMAHLRVFVGASQIAFGLLLVVGFKVNLLAFISSSGLAVMMGVALTVRQKISDPFWAKVPALIYFVISVFLAFNAFSGGLFPD